MAVGKKEHVLSLCLLEAQISVLNLSFTEAFLYQKKSLKTMNHESSQCLTSFYHGMTIFVIRSRKMKPYFKLHFSQPAYGKKHYKQTTQTINQSSFQNMPSFHDKIKKKNVADPTYPLYQ